MSLGFDVGETRDPELIAAQLAVAERVDDAVGAQHRLDGVGIDVVRGRSSRWWSSARRIGHER